MAKASVWIIKRKNKVGQVIYAVQWIKPGTRTRMTETVGPKRTLTEKLKTEKIREIKSGAYREIKAITFDEFQAEHLATIKGQLSEASYDQHERVLRQLKRLCNPQTLTEIDYTMLERFRNERQKETGSPVTVNKGLRMLQAILTKAVKRGYLVKNPLEGNRRDLWIKEPEPKPKHMEPGQFQQLLTGCLNDLWRGISIVGYDTGLRQSEITNLTWDDIHFDKGIMQVANKTDHATKSRKYREIPMTPRVIEALQVLRKFRFKSRYVFNNKHGRKLARNVSRDFGKIAVRGGLVDENKKAMFTMHDLRAAFVTNLLMAGVDVKTVQRLAGHADISTTLKYYAAVSKKGMIEAIEKMSDYTKTGVA